MDMFVAPPALAGVTAWLAPAGVFLLAGVVKGVLGLGLPTLAMALLVLWMPPDQAAALLLAPSLATNLQQAAPCRTLVESWRASAGLHAGIVIGALVGGLCWGVPSGRVASGLLGLVLVAYAIGGLHGARWRPLPRWGLPAGIATGLLTALTGAFVMPAVPWLQSLGLPRDRLVQAMGIAFSVATLALGANLLLADALPTSRMVASLLLMAPAVAGMHGGARLRARLPERSFKRCLYASLALLGGWQVAQAL